MLLSDHRGWKTALQSTCPLILLGVARLASTTGVDYQVKIAYTLVLFLKWFSFSVWQSYIFIEDLIELL